MNNLFLIILSIIGLIVSIYLYYSKTHGKKIVCIIGHNCEEVVKSKYGKNFGIENTVTGIFYYLLVFGYGISTLLDQNIFKESIIYYIIIGISSLSSLFSIYLAFVQAFVLKKWCDYCIISTIVSVLILLVLIT